jgi:hypothetical protein
VQLVDDRLGRDADGADKQLGALADDDIDEVVQATASVVATVIVNFDRSPYGKGRTS